MAPPINLSKYIAEVKQSLNLAVSDEIIEKDLLLTLILAEFEKMGLPELIFKGGTLLSRNHLQYHRFSEDLDFIHRNSQGWRELNRNQREKKIKQFIDVFVLKLQEVAAALGLEFSTDKKNTRFYTVLHGRVIYIFRMYYSENRHIRIEINFVERMIYPPVEVSVKSLTDFFDSKELRFTLGLKIENFKVWSYPLPEIILEKYRATLTRKELKERDLFDLFLIKGSLKVDPNQVVEKIRDSALIKKGLGKIIEDKLALLESGRFFKSEERIEDLAIIKYNPAEFEAFKEKIKPLLQEICTLFLR